MAFIRAHRSLTTTHGAVTVMVGVYKDEVRIRRGVRVAGRFSAATLKAIAEDKILK